MASTAPIRLTQEPNGFVVIKMPFYLFLVDREFCYDLKVVFMRKHPAYIDNFMKERENH